MRTVNYIKKFLETFPGPDNLREFLEDISKYFPGNIPDSLTDKYSVIFSEYMNTLTSQYSFNYTKAHFIENWFRRT